STSSAAAPTPRPRSPSTSRSSRATTKRPPIWRRHASTAARFRGSRPPPKHHEAFHPRRENARQKMARRRRARRVDVRRVQEDGRGGEQGVGAERRARAGAERAVPRLRGGARRAAQEGRGRDDRGQGGVGSGGVGEADGAGE